MRAFLLEGSFFIYNKLTKKEKKCIMLLCINDIQYFLFFVVYIKYTRILFFLLVFLFHSLRKNLAMRIKLMAFFMDF